MSGSQQARSPGPVLGPIHPNGPLRSSGPAEQVLQRPTGSSLSDWISMIVDHEHELMHVDDADTILQRPAGSSLPDWISMIADHNGFSPLDDAGTTVAKSSGAASAWVKAQNAKSGILPDNANVQRFQYKWRGLVTKVSKSIRRAMSAGGADKIKTRSCYNFTTIRIFMECDPDELCQDMFDHAPLRTQEVLGRESLKLKSLLDLPGRGDAEILPVMGAYVNIPGRYDESQIEQKAHPNYFFQVVGTCRFLKDSVDPKSAKAHEAYVGSSVAESYKGLAGRIRRHTLMSMREYLPENEETAQYRFTRAKDVVNNFRVAAVWDFDEDCRLPVLNEGLLITYLGLQNYGEDSERHPEVTFTHNRWLRQDLDLPNFEQYSLNRAWPLFQGIGEKKRRVETQAEIEAKISATRARRNRRQRERYQAKILDPDFNLAAFRSQTRTQALAAARRNALDPDHVLRKQARERARYLAKRNAVQAPPSAE